MPEKPEVITVSKKLKLKLLGKTFKKVDVIYEGTIDNISVPEFKEKLIGETIHDITTRGKWIVFHLDNYVLLTHLRMEGKFCYRNEGDILEKHQHVIFTFEDGLELRFMDTRKFGKMTILDKDNYLSSKPLSDLGYEFDDKNLTTDYLKDKFSKKKIAIKTTLLDQSIIAGIGNIYADEILFLSKINPYKEPCCLNEEELSNIIKNTVVVLEKAIKEGGTTIRSYTSEEGVTGLFQNSLHVHARVNEKCNECGEIIVKTRINGRGTYYCPKCQKGN